MKCENVSLFVLKAYVNEMPLRTIYIVIGISLCVVGLNLRVFEKTVSGTSLWDELWLGFVTESTVGYGDYYPVTHIGRLISGTVAILGIFTFSYNVMAIREASKLSDDEILMSKLIQKNKTFVNKLTPKAVFFIQKWWVSIKTKKVSSIFYLIEEAKRFKFMRKCLNTDFSASIKDRITESEGVITKNLQNSFKVFENLSETSENSFKFLRKALETSEKLKLLSKSYKFFQNPIESCKSPRYLTPSGSNIIKLRSKAVTNMFIRKTALQSPNYSLNHLD